MKKPFPTFIDETCVLFDYIYISAGQRGLQLRLSPTDLIDYTSANTENLTL
jgi:Cys-tRNA(Pro)/Cys-tRNA(Cys) deacylase